MIAPPETSRSSPVSRAAEADEEGDPLTVAACDVARAAGKGSPGAVVVVVLSCVVVVVLSCVVVVAFGGVVVVVVVGRGGLGGLVVVVVGGITATTRPP